METVEHDGLVILLYCQGSRFKTTLFVVRRAGEFAAEETGHGAPEGAGEGNDNESVRSQPG